MCLPLREDKKHSSGLGSSPEEKETIKCDAALPDKQRNRIKPILQTLQTLPDLSVKRKGTKPEDKPNEKQAARDDFKKSLREELSKERRIANTDEEKQAKLTQTKTTAENVKESQHYSSSDALDQRNEKKETLPEAQKLSKTKQILNGNSEEAHDLDKIVIQEPNDKQERDGQSNQNRSGRSTRDQVESEQGQGSLSLDHTTECNVTSSYHVNKDEAASAPGPSNSDQLPQREKALSEELEEIKAPPNAPKLDPIPKETCSDKLEQIKCPSCHHQFTGVRQRVLLLLRTHLGKMHFHR